MSVPLMESASAQFDAEGVAKVFLGPSRARQTWHVNRVVTSCTDLANFGISFTLYKGGDTPANQVDSTYTGVSGTSETSLIVNEGERLIGIWRGGAPNTWATVNLLGSMDGI